MPIVYEVRVAILGSRVHITVTRNGFFYDDVELGFDDAMLYLRGLFPRLLARELAAGVGGGA